MSNVNELLQNQSELANINPEQQLEHLKHALAHKEWQDANLLTRWMVGNSVGKGVLYGTDSLSIEDVKKMPLPTYDIINHLWQENSHNHYGFDVQRDIFKADGYNRFLEDVGWRKKETWLEGADFINKQDIPGHYPYIGLRFWMGNDIFRDFTFGLDISSRDMFSRRYPYYCPPPRLYERQRNPLYKDRYDPYDPGLSNPPNYGRGSGGGGGLLIIAAVAAIAAGGYWVYRQLTKEERERKEQEEKERQEKERREREEQEKRVQEEKEQQRELETKEKIRMLLDKPTQDYLDLVPHRDTLNEKMKVLRNAHAIETDVSTKFKLARDIEQTEKEHNEVCLKMEKIASVYRIAI